MSNLICQFLNCQKPAITHLLRVRERSLVEESHFCGDHGQATFGDYRSRVREGTQGVTSTNIDTISILLFDVSILYCKDAPEGPWQIYLEETNGVRGLGINSGPFECLALFRKFRHCDMPRPLTHDAMAAAITALGGRLQHIVIDKFFPSQKMFEAKLHIQQMNTTVVVDVRPSDAIILAVICDAPIMVSNEVLADGLGGTP